MSLTDGGGPRRILFVTYEYPPVGGGIGKSTRNMARSLAAKGYEVVILTSQFGELPKEEEQHGFRVFRIPVLRRHLNYANAYEVLSFAVSGMIHRGWLLRKFKPDAIVALLTIPSGIVAEAIARKQRVPWMNSMQGQDVPGFPDTPAWMHKLAWPVTKYLWHRAAHMISNSHGLAALAHESDSSVPIAVIPNIVNIDLYKPPEKPRDNETVRLIFAGRIVPFKRLPELFRAWKIVTECAEPPVELQIAGYGPQRPELEDLARELGITASVNFLGRLEEKELIETLQSADIFTNPSAGEGLPNAVQEAMSCGLPVVVSDIPPHRELIIEGEGGVVCEAADPKALAEAILPLINSAELRRCKGAEARDMIVNNFSADKVTQLMLELIARHFSAS